MVQKVFCEDSAVLLQAHFPINSLTPTVAIWVQL